MTLKKFALLAALLLCLNGSFAQEDPPAPTNDSPEVSTEDVFATDDEEEQPDEEPDCE